MLFYLIVTIIAIVVFIILLIYINYNLSSITKPTIYPPIENACPDFWLMDDNGSCKIPDPSFKNYMFLIGSFDPTKVDNSPKTYGYHPSTTTTPASINFNDPGWSTGNNSFGNNSLCNKKNWTNIYSISWDGVSNYNGKC